MKDKIFEIKKGVKLHVIETKKFKTDLFSIILTSKLNRNDVTYNALIPTVLRRGTNNIISQDEINKKLEMMYGAEFDCGVDKIGDNQFIKFYIETLNNAFVPNNENILEENLNLLIDIVFNPYVENDMFKKEYVETEKKNLEVLINSRKDNKDLYAFERSAEILHEKDVYSLYKYGYIEDLNKINSVNLYKAYNTLIDNAKIDLFISGDVNFEKIVKYICDNKIINNLKNRLENYNALIYENSIVKDENIIFESMNVTQGKLVVGMKVINSCKKDKFATVMYNTILGDSANSKLFRNVREKAHLAYSARSTYVQQKNDIFIRCGIEIKNYDKALEIVRKQISDMAKGDFSNEDVNEAKQYVLSTLNSLEEEQSNGIIYFYGQEIETLKTSLEEYKQIIKGITKKQIIEIANKVKIQNVYFLKD